MNPQPSRYERAALTFELQARMAGLSGTPPHVNTFVKQGACGLVLILRNLFPPLPLCGRGGCGLLRVCAATPCPGNPIRCHRPQDGQRCSVPPWFLRSWPPPAGWGHARLARTVPWPSPWTTAPCARAGRRRWRWRGRPRPSKRRSRVWLRCRQGSCPWCPCRRGGLWNRCPCRPTSGCPRGSPCCGYARTISWRCSVVSWSPRRARPWRRRSCGATRRCCATG